ncbi:MAG TPA: hypothetical protein VHS09_03755, partial [Polyangiaceae bacterium]|nr:hypothetical protein [Polyangiaceae bacterium]
TRLRRSGGPVALADASVLAENLLVAVDVAWQGDVRAGSVSFALPRSKTAGAYARLLAAAKKRMVQRP